ncbi:AAA family ATPase, partial [Candidatus Pacearchaeota archaeon]|nr:AAA family ATPase [Candidatus Pacearchaeota archaeon]
MTYIKKLVMKGFKSFARETTMELDRHMNLIVGPNGSGKSNVTDALCFVLGRLSIKSIRAAKASHLIFTGNKTYKGGNYAMVEIVFDNSDKTFVLDMDEISIKRIVKKNGQSVYKINNETKTRQEVIELLGVAGIDPHGFNIVLQGEIENFVKMHPEARRKVIEEVAGISIYEMRKEKSIKELDKTDERLKQIKAVLKERTNYLRNLENEREQALRFKKLEETVKRCKASIINKHIQEKDKDIKKILENISIKKKEIDKIDIHIGKIKEDMSLLNERINNISSTILKSSGLEQDQLNTEISILKQEIAGLIARKENFENQLHELDRRKISLIESLKLQEKEINDISKEKGKDSKEELVEKKKKLEDLEEGKRQFYLIKSNLSTINSQIEDKKRQIQMLRNDSNYILTQIESIEKEIKINEDLDKHTQKIVGLKHSIENNKRDVIGLDENLLEKSNISARVSQIIDAAQKVKDSVSKLDICPLCKTKITKDHINEVIDKSNKDINNSKKIIEDSSNDIENIKSKLIEVKERIAKNSLEVNQRNIDIVKIKTISEKKLQLK